MARRILPAIVVVGLLAAGTTSFASQLAQRPAQRSVEPRLHETVASLRVLPKAAEGAANEQARAWRLERRDAVEKAYKEMMAEVRKRREALIKLVGPGKFSKNAELATQRSLLLDHLGALRTQLTQLQRDVDAIDTEMQRIGATGPHEPADDPARRPEAVEAKPAELRMRRERLTQQLEETSKECEVTSKEYDEIEKAIMELGVDPEHEAERVEIALLEARAIRMAHNCGASISIPNRAEIMKPAGSTGSAGEAKGGAERADDHSR